MVQAVSFDIILVLSEGNVAEFKAIFGVPKYSRPLLVAAALPCSVSAMTVRPLSTLFALVSRGV